MCLGHLKHAGDLDQVWAPDPTIEEKLLPVRLTDSNWEEIVVDPLTNKLRDGSSWFIFVYYKKCPLCKKFKPTFEQIARNLTEETGVRFGMIDVVEAERLKETLMIKVSPWIAFIKDGMLYEYDNLRTRDSFRNFIYSDL